MTVQVTPLSADVAATSTRPAGRVSISTTLRATDGPAFDARRVQLIGRPAVAVAGPVLVTARLAVGATADVAVLALSSTVGSGVVEVTVAVLDRVRPAKSAASSPLTVTVTALSAPAARLPSAQLTAGPPEQVTPPGASTTMSPRPDGSASLSVTPRASEGPLFRTVSVQLTRSPGTTVAGPVLVTLTPPEVVTGRLDDARSSPASGSGVDVDTVAVLVTVSSG